MNRMKRNREQMREFDRLAIEQVGLAGVVLMENAGRGCADVLCRIEAAGPIVICCGKGNNGGDGFVIARHLDLRGHAVRVLLCGRAGDVKGDAAVNLHALQRLSIAVEEIPDEPAINALFDQLGSVAWVVDALLGTGAKGDPRPPLDRAIQRMNEVTARKLAVDVPSGLDCDTGRASRATFRAEHTCTFVADKIGFDAGDAGDYLGQVHVLDVGVPLRAAQLELD